MNRAHRIELGARLVELVEQIIDERIEQRLAARGADVVYCSRGPLPPGASARAFRTTARAMLAADAAGVRREGGGPRDRVYFVSAEAWRRWRTSARSVARPVVSDEDLATDALEAAGLRLVRGGRR